MTAAKSDSLASKKYFDEHVKSIRTEKNKINRINGLSDKQRKVLIDLLLSDVKEKQSTDEFKLYAEIRKADYAKIRAFVIERVGDAKKVTKEDMQEAVDFFYAKKDKKESREKIESKEKIELPQLESENHKIDQGKSKKEKIAEGWKEKERIAFINGNKTKIKILEKELAPGAFVREYQDDDKMPKHFIGEQLFNWKAVLSLGLQDRLPTWKNMVAMRGETKEESFLRNNFQKDGNNIFPGYWNPITKTFYDIGEHSDCWLAGGSYVELKKDNMNYGGYFPQFGFSLHLLKN